MYEDVLIYAKSRGYAPRFWDPVRTLRGATYMFDCTLLPAVPLRVGLVVRIHMVTDRSVSSYDDYHTYHAMGTGIVGTIKGIRAMEQGLTEFFLKHEDPNASQSIETAYIAVPHIPGVTVQLSPWQTLLRWILYPFLPRSRDLYLEKDVGVVDTIVPWRSSEPNPDDDSWEF